MIFDAVPLDPFALVQAGGVPALLLLIIVGGYRGWWVWGYQYRALQQSEERWQALALRSANLTESVAQLSQQSREAS